MIRPRLPLLAAVLMLLAYAGEARAEQLSFIQNEQIKLGVDLDLGGAITYLSKSSDDLNVINSFDWGRQVQMSFYSGPVPYSVDEKHPRKDWVGLGWNPIQVGDCFGHRARVLEVKNDGRQIYVKSVPMQWPLDDVPGECTFESWLELRGSSVLARGRLNNARTDHTQYTARGQELPAVYTNGPFHRIVTYSGTRPFTGEAIAERKPMPPPRWDMWLATENWCALVNDAGWGLGVWNPRTIFYGGGFNDKPGVGGPKDNPCGYLAPHAVEILDHDIGYDFSYELILGSIEEIRAEVYRQPRPAALPRWNFTHDRAGWYYRNATDSGWPIQGALTVQWDALDPQILSPKFFAPGKATALVLEAASGQPARGTIYYATLDQPGFTEDHTVHFDFAADTAAREYRIPLPGVEALIELRLDPAPEGKGTLRVKSIRLE